MLGIIQLVSYFKECLKMNDDYTAKYMLEQIEKYWPETNNLANEFIIFLSKARDIGMVQGCNIIETFNLSPAEFDILASLRRTESPHILSPTELQRSMLITSGGLTKLLYQLEASKLVKRSIQKQDKRSKLVHLTAKGKITIEKTMSALLQVENTRLLGTLTQSELKQLNKLLSKAASAFEE